MQAVPSPMAVARPRKSYRTWFALATVVLVNAALIVDNFAPYLGLTYAGGMTMYSGITDMFDNHLFMPKIPLSDADTYVSIIRVNAGVETPPARQFQAFAAWTRRERRVVNINFVRYHTSRICQSAPSAGLQLALRTEAGQRLEFDNACSEPSMLRYALLSKYPECKPRCRGILEEWAIGKLRGAGA